MQPSLNECHRVPRLDLRQPTKLINITNFLPPSGESASFPQKGDAKHCGSENAACRYAACLMISSLDNSGLMNCSW